jgi:hypothetical protein
MLLMALVCAVITWKSASRRDPGHPNGVLDAIFIVHVVVLRHHVDDLAPWRDDDFIHVVGQPADVFDRDFLIRSISW